MAMCETDGNPIVEKAQEAGQTMRWRIRKS
jgi:hypothetical protein